jgi:RNA polymerase sigma-70 factor (ECF subfamily)
VTDFGDIDAGGSAAAVDLLTSFREHEPALLRFIAARIGCRATAQDIVQEVFLRIHSPPAEPVHDPRAFLFRIAVNLATNHRAVARRRSELTEEVKDLLWSGIDEATPERNFLATEQLTRVTGTLSRLPERTRQILAMNRFEGMKQVEIAQRLGISTTAVEKHLRNALSLLLEATQDDER